ncbi:aldo/keto reductase [Microbacterium sp. dk485]|uniref:aldo/keto reductase n=1 Tax=Microbacterium sp. dk485 TaxID=2560021 RepID=UPI001073F7AC|nr:aldo/keto reductase [Microbacterium sp. dk485]TFV81915.1 aldo/keto reductase [Microbacterium sp. dk485]
MTTDTAGIALGTMYFGTRLDRAASFAILDRFVERGGRWLDTADNYAFWVDESGLGGASETVIGAWLQANPGARDEVLLSTKVGADPTVAGAWPESMEGLRPQTIHDALDRSLARLGTDHVDLYWAHVEDRSVDLDAQVEAFGSVIADGRARRIGASNHATWRVERARSLARQRGVEPFTAVQLRHTYLQPIPFAPLPDQGHVVATPEALDYAESEGLAVWAYSTLLTGAYTREERLQEPYRHLDTRRRLEALDRVAEQLGATRNQVVLAWLLGSTPRITPIVGVSGISQLDETMDARDLHLDADARTLLDEAAGR